MNTFLKYRPDQYSKAFTVILLALDILATFVTFYLATLTLEYTPLLSSNEFYTFGMVWVLLWVIISIFTEMYEVNQHRRLARIIRNTFRVAFIHLPFAGGVAFVIGLENVSFQFLISLYALFIAVALLIKTVLLMVYRFVRNLDRNKYKAVIVGYTSSGQNLYKHFIHDKTSGYHFAGFFDEEHDHPLVVGNIKKLKKYCIRENVNEIFFALPYDRELIREISSFADDNFIRFAILQDIGSSDVSTVQAEIYDDDLPVLAIKASKSERQADGRPYQRALSVIRSLNF